MKYRVVNTDNFGGDYPDERFIGETFVNHGEAVREADRLNGSDYNSPRSPRYHKVVEEGYILQPGFTP